MNVTDQFVFVHMPKTGGTFFADCLRQIHGDRIENYGPLGRAYWGWRSAKARVLGRPAHFEYDKHANCRDIPEGAAGLPILSAMRDPADWYVSNYRFGWWKSHPEKYPGLKDDPRWPDLDFADYMDLSFGPWLTVEAGGVAVNPSLGRLSVLFISFYCRNPAAVLTAPDDEIAAAFRRELFDVEFLAMEDLNAETHRVLSRYYAPDQIGFVAEKAKIAPRGNRRSEDTVDRYVDADLRAEIKTRDRLLYGLFPQYG